MTRYGDIRFGDSHAGGGSMIEASGIPVSGKNLCLMGDRGYCPTHNGTFPLVSGGNPAWTVNGRMAVFEPAKLACGCSVISSCRDFFALVDVDLTSATHGAIDEVSGVAQEAASHAYDQQFQILDSIGRPVPNAKYKIVASSGEIRTGITDAEGKAARISSATPEEFHIYLVNGHG